MTTRNCPACGRVTEHKLVFKKRSFDILRCEVCGIGRTQADDFDPEACYNEGYFNGGQEDGYVNYLESESVLRTEFSKSAKILLDYVKKDGRILEVGCAFGFFLLEASDYFRVEGIEISDYAANYARSRGLSVRTGVVNEAALKDLGMFDAIVLFDVIEHLQDPYETLSICWQHLNPGGVVMFTTGDFGSFPARALKDKWRLMTPPQHLFFFTKASVSALANRLGAEMKRFDHPWKIVPLELILFQLPGMLGLKWKIRMKLGASIGIPVNLFDAMRVVYQKNHKPSFA